MKTLIDADIVAYRASYSTENLEPEDAEEKVDELLARILEATTFDDTPVEYFLTGSSNFRFDIAISHPYKGNRKSSTKPAHLSYVRDYLVGQWGAVVSEGEEADDLIAIAATNYGPDTIIASVDKDFLQVPCWHYNTSKGTLTQVGEWEGLRFFYQQILTGDAADNIKGLMGIGPKKSEKMIQGAVTELELYQVCLDAYDNDVERVIENGQLLWLRREVGQVWQPPGLS